MKSPTPAQWIQLALDVLAAIGMALLAIFK